MLRLKPPGRFPGVMASVVVLTLALAACGGGDTTATSKSPAGELVVVSSATPSSLAYDKNAGNTEAHDMWAAVHATLIRNTYVTDAQSGQLTQDRYAFEGVLAESYQVSPDGKTYTFTLRQGVVSAQGNAFTADDVIWSFGRRYYAGTSIAPSSTGPYLTDPKTQLTKIDDHTVAFTVAKPGYGLVLLSILASANNGQVFDTTELKKHATAGDEYAIDWSTQNANYGLGAYTVQSIKANEEMVLVANPAYVLGAPKITKVTYRVVPDAGTRANAVRAGDADMAISLRPADIADLKAVPTVKTLSYQAPLTTRSLITVTDKAPFDNAKVRQALAYAIPYDQIVDGVFRGTAVRNPGLLDPTAPGYVAAGVPTYGYDPAKAKALLAEAGVAVPVSFGITVMNSMPDLADIAVQIQSFAKDAGFDVKVDTVPEASFWEGYVGRANQSMMMFGAISNAAPAYLLTTSFKDIARTNPSGWVDRDYLALVEQGTELADPVGADAAAIWNRAETTVMTAVPQIPLVLIQPTAVLGKGVSGYTLRMDTAVDYSMFSKS